MLRVTVEDQIVGNLIVVDAIRNKNAGYATIEANDIVVPATHPLLLSTDGPNALFQAFAVRWGA